MRKSPQLTVVIESRTMRVVVRSLLCLVIAFSGWKVIQAISEEEAINALQNFSTDCEPKPTEEDLRNIIKNEDNVPRSTKCYRLCLTNKMNLLKDCKLDGDNLFSLMEIVFDDKEKEVHDIANICNGKVACADECDAAHDYAMCILNEIKSRQWPMENLEL